MKYLKLLLVLLVFCLTGCDVTYNLTITDDEMIESALFWYDDSNENKKIVGAIGLRWKEVPKLMEYGGLIGYSIRPSERGKGYATKMLQLALKEFEKINKEKVLITCKDFNIPSKRVIEKNGGIYENSYYNEEDKYTYLRYWINLKVRVI